MIKSSICSVCKDLLIRPEEPLDQEVRIPYERETIRTSASEGCPICLILWDRMCSLKSTLSPDEPIHGVMCFYDPMYANHDIGNEKEDPVRLYFGVGDGTGWEYFFSAFLKIYLRLQSEVSDREEMIIKEGSDAYERPSIAVSSAIPSSNTGDDLCLERMKGWLQKCLRDHKLCCLNDANKESLPTRLIDMGNIDGPRLVVCKEEGMDIQKAQYVTVSHRWRQEGMPKLLRSNAETLKQRIDPTILPLAFQDSLILAKRLDIRYIWIDALCILQDDESDWERESSIMGQVYRNAVCNFGASAAAKKPVGLFIDRDPRLASAFSVSIHRKGHEEKYFGYTEQMHDDVLKTNLSDRGWILQERLLSPRSVYFGQQLTWECSELVACETFPEGTPATRYLSPWGRSGYPFRMTNLLLKNLKYTHKDEEQHETKEIYRKWLYIAEEFMKCRLTYEDDRFPALSGLAKCFQQVLNDEYVAGLWRNDLLRGLLWRTRPNTRNLPLKGHAPYPSTYRAPSWSWGSVAFETFNEHVHHMLPIRYYADIEEVSVTLAGSDPMGKVSGGYIRISAYMKKNCTPVSWAVDRYPKRSPDHFDDRERPQGKAPPSGALHLILGYSEVSVCNQNKGESGTFKDATLSGLILEPTRENVDEYRRIGMFTHAWGPGRRNDPDHFPESVDFENEGFERHSVTII